MIYKIAICDDDKVYTEKLDAFVRNYCARNNIGIIIDVFCESGPIFDSVESGKYYDIYILDVEMPKYGGMDIAKRIKEVLPKTMIILVTAHDEFAMEGYELDVFRYISKKNMERKMTSALRDAFNLLALQEGKFYIISNSRRFEKIGYSEICYICKKQKNSIIVTEDASEIPVRKTLAEVYKELDGDEFTYIDRCYIINMSKVRRIENHRVYLTCGEVLTMSAGHATKIKKQISLFWEDRI